MTHLTALRFTVAVVCGLVVALSGVGPHGQAIANRNGWGDGTPNGSNG